MRRACLLGLFVLNLGFSGSKLYLKTRIIDTGSAEDRTGKRAVVGASRYIGRQHLIIQFNHVPGDADRQALADRGAAVLGYVHENGLMISTTDPAALDDLGLLWTGSLNPADKISPLLAAALVPNARPVVIEVFPDADIDAVRQAVIDRGAVLSDNPDLTPLQLLSTANAEQIADLSLNADIAYIFPASDDLAAGRQVMACANALTTEGTAGQYIPKIGDGWDGPGQNAVTLGYFFSNVTDQLPEDSVRSEILRAFNEWAKYIKLTLRASTAADAAQTVNILFATGAHGDGYPFDGPGGVLAHTFYPAPPNPEPLAGDMHFDNAETWKIGANRDLFSVALHEFGHALGLGHSDLPGAVMYPYYAQVTGLTADDIAAAQSLYATQDSSSTPSTPSTPASPTTPSDPSPSNPTTTASTPLSLTLSALPATTTADAVLVVGTATGGAGNTIVGWSSDRGSSGLAQGGSAWTAQVPLVSGANTLTFTATDSALTAVSHSVVITRQVTAGPVLIQFNYPAGAGAFTTAQSPVNVQGVASQSSGIQAVTWTNDKGGSGKATGTTSWDSGAIQLQTGLNTVAIAVLANDGTSASRTVLITYSPAVKDDTTAPSLNILSPASPTSATTADTITVRGTASDNGGVASVVWFTAAGDSGTATGTTSWATSPIPLIHGDNSIIIRAFDTSGNMSWRSVNVTRQ